MKLKISKSMVSVLRSIISQFLEVSTDVSPDVSCLDAGMQGDWKKQLCAEAKEDAKILLGVLDRATTSLEFSEAEAESSLRSLTGIRLHLVNTVLGDSDIENMEAVIVQATRDGNQDVYEAVQIYAMLGSIESAILSQLMGDDYDITLPEDV